MGLDYLGAVLGMLASQAGVSTPPDEPVPPPMAHGDGQPVAPPKNALPPQLPSASDSGPDADGALIDGRRRPGFRNTLPERLTQDNIGAVRAPPPEAFPTSEFPIPDRYRLLKAFCPEGGIFAGVKSACHSTRDPYHQNVLKGDRRSACRPRRNSAIARRKGSRLVPRRAFWA